MATLATTDSTSVADLYAGPGNDTRQWISYGIVCPDTNGAHSVRFNDDDGNPLPQGVLVDVTLQPSGITVPCRVGAQAAGAGEAEYNPFGPGDEVLVAVPEGNERAGCVILCRLTNSADVFPTKVAGQDVTQNNFRFSRHQVPFIHEVGQGYMLRSAQTTASFSIDPTGNVILNDGSHNALMLNHSVILLQESTGQALVQIDPSKFQVALQAKTTALLLDSSASSFLTKGTFTLLTSGQNIGGHAVTVEQVVVLIEGFMTAWGLTLTAAVPTFGIGAQIAATLTPATLPGLMAAGIATGAALPLTAEKAALVAAMSTPPDPSGTVPGVGRAGFIY